METRSSSRGNINHSLGKGRGHSTSRNNLSFETQSNNSGSKPRVVHSPASRPTQQNVHTPDNRSVQQNVHITPSRPQQPITHTPVNRHNPHNVPITPDRPLQPIIHSPVNIPLDQNAHSSANIAAPQNLPRSPTLNILPSSSLFQDIQLLSNLNLASQAQVNNSGGDTITNHTMNSQFSEQNGASLVPNANTN